MALDLAPRDGDRVTEEGIYRQYVATGPRSREFGRVSFHIVCPFCGDTVKAFTWSLCGGGKKCSCGALHTGMGVTLYRDKKKAGLQKS